MLSRYHLTSDNETWSEDALSFLSYAVSGSLNSLMNIRYGQYFKSPIQPLITLDCFLSLAISQED